MFKEFFDKKKLITFDLDGTIVKSEKVWDLAFKEVAKLLSVSPITTGICGNPVADRWEYILKENVIETTQSVNELADLTEKEYVKNIDQLELTDGFWPFVAELKLSKNLKLALVTNTSRVITDQVILQFDLKEVFDFVICGDEVKNPKPNSEIYKKTLVHFKMSSKDVLAFEDSLTGCISAAKAGIKIICVWDAETPQRKFPDEVLDFTGDFTPFPGEMNTTYFEDITQMAKDQKPYDLAGSAEEKENTTSSTTLKNL
jgi:HAD superfamily hydrolase (TIGR01509 family)